MIGPEVPEKIQRARDERLGRTRVEQTVVEESSEDEGFAGPALEDFKNDHDVDGDEDRLAKQRLQKNHAASLDGTKDDTKDSKHDSWMSMRPEWDQPPAVVKNPTEKTTNDTKIMDPGPKKLSLLEQHKQKRRQQGLDVNEHVKYDANEGLNSEIRKEVFRKASGLNDRFTRGS